MSSKPAPMFIGPPTTFTFASHSPEDDSDGEHGSARGTGRASTSGNSPTSPARASLSSNAAKHRRASLATSPSRTRESALSSVAPTSPALARAKTSVVLEQNENAPGNDVPFEEIAALLTTRGANNSAVGEQVRPKLKVSASGKFEDQFYHAHEGSRAMGKLKNRAYLKKSEKKDSGKSKNVNGKDVEQFSDSDIVFAGYLVKQGSFWKTWRRRYFILRRDVPVLSYYDSAEELTKLGEITVDGSTSVRPTPREGFPFQFVVEHGGRKLTLVAEDGKPATDAWIANLQLTIARRAQEAARASLDRKSLGLRMSENGSFLDDLAALRKSSTATGPVAVPGPVPVPPAARESPHGAPMKRFQTDAALIATAMQESIAAREEERLRERRLRQSRATNLEELPPTWKATSAAARRDSTLAGTTAGAAGATRTPGGPNPARRFRSLSAGSVLSTRSIDYEPMRPARDDSGLGARGSHDGSSTVGAAAGASAYPVNEHPQTRAPCLSLPAFKPGPTLELAVSVGSKGAQEAAHMVVVMSAVAPGKEPREMARTEMQSALSLRPCGGDFFARDFSAALSVPLGAKDVLHFEVFACKNPGTEVLASQTSLAFVRIAPVDVLLSRDATIVLECHRARHASQLLFLMLDRVVPSELVPLHHAFPYAKRHFVADIVPVERPLPGAAGVAAPPASERLLTSSGSTGGGGLGASYGEMVRGHVNSSEANHVFISEELSASFCSISVALAFLRHAQARNRARVDAARARLSAFERKFGPLPGSPTHAPAGESEAAHEAEAALARYSRLRDTYRTCEDYCAKLEAMLADGREPGVTGALKRSTQKKDVYTEFMPTNLNVHLTRAKRVALAASGGAADASSSSSSASAGGSGADELVHAVVTHGCTAAHVLGFKDGGLRRLLQASAQAPKDEKLLEKIEQRQDVVRSQALAVAATAFLTLLSLAVHARSRAHMERLRLVCSTGFLVSIESLLSTVRSEKGMIEDMVEGVKWLNASVSLQVVDAAAATGAGAEGAATATESAAANTAKPGAARRLKYAKCIDVSSDASGAQVVATFALPSELFAGLPAILQKGDAVKLHAVMFTQGINEMQSVANTVLDTRLQDEINFESIQTLERYFRVYQSFVKYHARHTGATAAGTSASASASASEANDARLAELPHLGAQIAILVEKLNVSIKPHVQKKNVNILLETSDICRRLGAGRTTCCKSGKDRTAMSVTLESSQLLVDSFHVKQGVHLCTAMRERGVRRVNVLANTGKDKYAFNSFQLKYIPECYKPPTASADSHVAS